MRNGVVVVMVVVTVGLAGCARKKVELQYEEPVTKVWIGGKDQLQQQQPQAPAEAAPTGQPVPAQAYPPSPAPAGHPRAGAPEANAPAGEARGPFGLPPSQPIGNPSVRQQPPSAQQQPPWDQQQQPPPQAQPSGGWQGAPQPKTVVTDPTTGATTVVIPDQNPTTQTTIRRRTGWVRGGYD